MDWVKIITDYYIAGLYTIDQVKRFVIKGKITSDQFKEITGEDYVA